MFNFGREMMHEIRRYVADRFFGRVNGQAAPGFGQAHREGRSVAEIVEQDPGQVSEVWCRKIFRQMLLVLERQYAMQLPHQPITPETVIVRENGDLLLLPTQSYRLPEVASDLTALAKVVHFAITREAAAARPLRGRALQGYSDSIITAIDRSMAQDPAARPHTINELRALLGIVAPNEVPLALAVSHTNPVLELQLQAPRFEQLAASAMPSRQLKLWTLAAGIAVIVLGTTLAMLLRTDSTPLDAIKVAGQQPGDVARLNDSAGLNPQRPSIPGSVPAAAGHFDTPASEAPASQLDTDKTPDSQREITRVASAPVRATQAKSSAKKKPVKTIKETPRDAPSPDLAQQSTVPDEPAQRPALPASEAIAANAVLDLHIKPWGMVSVDGLDRGISPPMKRVTVSPGRHSILVKNPSSPARVLEIDTTKGERRIAVDFTGASD